MYKTDIPLTDLDKIGEASEVIIDTGDIYPVDIVLHGKVIGKGKLYREKDGFKLKVEDINV